MTGVTKGGAYTVELAEAHAEVLARALDLYSRVGTGQLEEVLAVFDAGHELPAEARELARAYIDSAKVSVGLPASGHRGIHGEATRDEFRVAYDLQQVVRHRLAWDRRPEGGFQVDFDEPTQTSAGVPLAAIRRLGGLAGSASPRAAAGLKALLSRRVVERTIRLAFEEETVEYKARVLEPRRDSEWPEALGNDLTPEQRGRVESWFGRATRDNPVRTRILEQPACGTRSSWTARP